MCTVFHNYTLHLFNFFLLTLAVRSERMFCARVRGLFPRYMAGFFLEGGVRSLMNAVLYSPNRLTTCLVATQTVVTERTALKPRHVKGH